MTIDVRLWWVVFTDTDKAGWWTPLLKPGYSHCWAFTELAPHLVLMVNPVKTHVAISCQDVWPYAVMQAAERDGKHEVLAYDQASRYPVPTVVPPIRRGLLVTCASVLGYMLGVDERIMTPYRLRCALLKDEARIVVSQRSRD